MLSIRFQPYILASKAATFLLYLPILRLLAAYSYIIDISPLVPALWLINLAGRTLLYGPLKCYVDFVARLFRDLSPIVLNL